MAEITASLVKDLRERTGAGMMDCKKALNETAGDIEAAIDWLRKKGLAAAAKKSGRVTAEGLVGAAVNGTKGAVVWKRRAYSPVRLRIRSRSSASLQSGPKVSRRALAFMFSVPGERRHRPRESQ